MNNPLLPLLLHLSVGVLIVVLGGAHAQDGKNVSSRRSGVDVGVQVNNAPLGASLDSLLLHNNNTNNNSTNNNNNIAALVTQPDASAAAIAVPLLSSTTAAPQGCVPGFFTSGQTCALCPWGFWCNQSQAFACPMGTYSGVTGASSSAACAACAPGSYTSAPGAPACLACPTGQYCAGGASTPRACPLHTTSSAGGSSILDCACLPDYLCTYTRRVTLQLALNTSLSLQTIQSDSSIAGALRDGVVLALGLYGVPGVTATLLDFVGLL